MRRHRRAVGPDPFCRGRHLPTGGGRRQHGIGKKHPTGGAAPGGVYPQGAAATPRGWDDGRGETIHRGHGRPSGQRIGRERVVARRGGFEIRGQTVRRDVGRGGGHRGQYVVGGLRAGEGCPGQRDGFARARRRIGEGGRAAGQVDLVGADHTGQRAPGHGGGGRAVIDFARRGEGTGQRFGIDRAVRHGHGHRLGTGAGQGDVAALGAGRRVGRQPEIHRGGGDRSRRPDRHRGGEGDVIGGRLEPGWRGDEDAGAEVQSGNGEGGRSGCRAIGAGQRSGRARGGEERARDQLEIIILKGAEVGHRSREAQGVQGRCLGAGEGVGFDQGAVERGGDG